MIANDSTYHRGLSASLLIHAAILVILFIEPHTSAPVLHNTERQPSAPSIVNAVSVDRAAIEQTVQKLKNIQEQKHQAEQAHQLELTKQAQRAQQQRITAEHQLQQLKTETAALALKKKQEIDQQQQHLKALHIQKEQETQRIVMLKKQQEIMQKQQAQAQAAAAKQAAATQATAKQTAHKAATSGEIDRYKAMIINAISQQWILPDQIDRSLSSQFRIHLAPNGTVLNVTLIRSSGDPILDRSAQRAIYKASPLPVPTDAQLFAIFQDISLTVRPETIRS